MLQLRGNTVELDGWVAIVTGAGAAGTGRAIALRLAQEGANVVVADIDGEGAAETVRQIQAGGGSAGFVGADMRVDDDVEAMVEFAEREFGGLDVLVNNAGWTDPPYFPDGPPAHWGATLDLNLRGPMLATQLAIERMRKRGGCIVNIASVAGLGYEPHDSPEYAAAKAGLIRFTATLAPLGERMNIRVNCVIPHWIATEHVKAAIAAMSPAERAEVPERLNQPEEIADAVVAFIHDDDLAGRVLVCWCGEPRRLLDPQRRE
jgi:NAD(P)-dependent dehydrogenase (short-subunit alcohol dehydrogenase family)